MPHAAGTQWGFHAQVWPLDLHTYIIWDLIGGIESQAPPPDQSRHSLSYMLLCAQSRQHLRQLLPGGAGPRKGPGNVHFTHMNLLMVGGWEMLLGGLLLQ